MGLFVAHEAIGLSTVLEVISEPIEAVLLDNPPGEAADAGAGIDALDQPRHSCSDLGAKEIRDALYRVDGNIVRHAQMQ